MNSEIRFKAIAKRTNNYVYGYLLKLGVHEPKFYIVEEDRLVNRGWGIGSDSKVNTNVEMFEVLPETIESYEYKEISEKGE